MSKKMLKWKITIPAQTIEVTALYQYTAKDRGLRLAEGVKVEQINGVDIKSEEGHGRL
jgi:hypothetical protein